MEEDGQTNQISVRQAGSDGGILRFSPPPPWGAIVSDSPILTKINICCRITRLDCRSLPFCHESEACRILVFGSEHEEFA